MKKTNRVKKAVDLKAESRDFDLIYEARSKNMRSVLIGGDRVESYFYKNPWRYDFSRRYAFGTVLEEFQKLAKKDREGLNILDIGCGNGWLSINANLRSRDHWDCIDISRKAVAMANVHKKKLKIAGNHYFMEEIGSFRSDKKYDIITCVNTLHHLTDLNLFYAKIKNLLKPRGKVFISDVSPDLFSEVNAAFVLLARKILEATEGVRYFERFKNEKIQVLLKKIVQEWRSETDDHKQSAHDHFHPTSVIVSFLKKKFQTLYFRQRGGILMRLLGGLRGDVRSLRNLAGQLSDFEEFLLKKNIIRPYTYTFVGKF